MVKRAWVAGLLAAAGVVAASGAVAAESAPGPGAGWTGATHPAAVIAARQALMKHIETLMEPIDTLTVKPVKDAQQLRANAAVIGAMLLAVPHLFPPTTNRYDPKSQMPQTLALPAIWQDFASFYALAGAAAQAAGAVATARGGESLRAASQKLRASCDACHALFLRKYEGPKQQDSDTQFDFDAALGGKSGAGSKAGNQGGR